MCKGQIWLFGGALDTSLSTLLHAELENKPPLFLEGVVRDGMEELARHDDSPPLLGGVA